MNWADVINETLRYLEDNIMTVQSPKEVAMSVHVSTSYLQNSFQMITGYTIGEYVRSRRLYLAAMDLLEKDEKIIDIAQKYGYETPESFTKAFTRFHGVAPSVAREGNTKLVLFNPLVIKLTVDGGKNMEYKIVQTEAKKFIALVRSFKTEIINDEANHEVADFWAECNANQMLSPIWMLREDGKRDLYGLCSPTTEDSDTFEYGIGIIVDKDTAEYDEEELKKAGFRIWNVNPGTYVVFECKGENGDCIAKTWTQFYKEFLPQSGYEAAEETDYELYFDSGHDDLFCELWIPVKKG